MTLGGRPLGRLRLCDHRTRFFLPPRRCADPSELTHQLKNLLTKAVPMKE